MRCEPREGEIDIRSGEVSGIGAFVEWKKREVIKARARCGKNNGEVSSSLHGNVLRRFYRMLYSFV